MLIEADGIQRKRFIQMSNSIPHRFNRQGASIGAITIYIPPTDGPDEVWEIIDGAVDGNFWYMGNEFIPRADLIKTRG